MKTINLTFRMEESEIVNFENWFRHHVEVIDLRILPDTESLYENDKTFQSIVRTLKKAQRVRDNYINEKNI